jgi:hypothetical protein
MGLKIAARRLLPLLYFLTVSLPHHPFSSWLDDAFVVPVGFHSVQHIADIASAALLVGIVAMGIRIAVVHRWQAIRHFSILLVLVLLMYAADYYLVVNNIERIHFPQYAILAVLLGLCVRSEPLIFFVTSFAGFLDEFLQYLMNPIKTNYLDFNDIVLNILGAALGVAFLLALRRPAIVERTTYEKRFKLVFLLSMAGMALVVFTALALGRIVMLVEHVEQRSVFHIVNGKLSFIMSFERHDQLWTKSYFGKVFHVLSPAEGLAIIAGLFMATWGAVRWLNVRWHERIP